VTPTRTLATASLAMVVGLSIVACSPDASSSGTASPGGGFGKCEVTGNPGSITLSPIANGTLTVSTVLPSNGWWDGPSPDAIDGGFEYCVAANIAHRAGLTSVAVQNQSWDQLISASNTAYDVGLANITITDDRKKVFEFSDPYFQSNLGVAVRKGADVTAENIRTKKIGVLQGNVGAQFTNDTLKPADGVRQFQSDTEMFTALQAGQVDAVITDTTLVLSDTAASNGQLVVVGQFLLNQDYGIILPKGSTNVAAVDAALKDMRADGTMAALSAKWLKPLFGTDPSQIPVWK
jgi:ABC-type amino acid transport substrate-binding protein